MEPGRPPQPPVETDADLAIDTRTVTAKRPNHVWHVDLTVVPTAAGFWVPWSPLSLPQVWPFFWWIGCAVDHYSRLVLGFALFTKQPTSASVRAFLGRTIHRIGACPKYIVCDKGVQFTSDGFKAWCKRNNIRPRYGAVHRYGSIAVIERFIKSLKEEWLRRLIIPLRLDAMRIDLSVYTSWFNEHRPHQALEGKTPLEVYHHLAPANAAPRFEPRTKWPMRGRRGATAVGTALVVTYHEGRRQLPILELRQAA